MSAIIKEVFQVLLAVVIPLAAFTTGLRAPQARAGRSPRCGGSPRSCSATCSRS